MFEQLLNSLFSRLGISGAAGLAQLGPVQFYVSSSITQTISDLSITKTARIAKHEILGKKPKLEFQGVDLKEISFNVYLSTSLGANINNFINDMDTIIENGVVCPFVVGSKYHGDFLVSSIGEAVKHTTGRGDTQVVEVTISLTEYVDD